MSESFHLGTRVPSSLFPDTNVLCDNSVNAGQRDGTGGYGKSETPRTPIGTPRTPRERQGAKCDQETTKDQRQTSANTEEMLVSQVLSDIDTSQISRMKEEFDKRGGSVKLIEFLELFRDTLMEEAARPNFRDIVGKLRTLFEEIDINGDQNMSWEEFTSYIVLNGGSRVRGENAIQHYQESELHHEIPLNHLEKIRYFPEIERLIICDKSEVVRMYKPTTQKFTDDIVLVKELRGHTGPILNAEYIPSEGLLCTSSSDNTIHLWDALSTFRFKAKFSTPVPQLAMLWNPSQNLLYTAGTDGSIFSWNLSTLKQTAQLVGHTDMVLDLKLIPNTSLMASASLDAHVYLWDLTTGEISTQVKGHTKGVVSLTYNAKQKLLFSGSFDRDILAWNPVVDSVVFKLKGHHSSIVGVECIEDTPYLISGDKDGQFKLWDIRTYDCLQTFTSATPMQGLAAFTVIPQKKRLVAGSKKIYAFDYHKPGIPWLTDDRHISAVLYNSKSMTILTAASRDVKIWDASTGVQLQTFRNITTEDITAACLDKRERKVVLGTSEGGISVYNYTNGILLRALSSHKQEVTALFPVGKNTFISCSTDGRIWLHDEQASAKKQTVIASFSAPPTAIEPAGIGRDVTCVSVSKDIKAIVSATIAHSVRVWGMEDTSMEFQHKLHTSEVTGVIVFHSYPVFASCDCMGNIFVFAIKPSILKNHCLCKLVNLQSSGQPCGVYSMAFLPGSCSLITGDDAGDIKIWSFTRLFEYFSILSISKHRGSRPPSGTSSSPIAPLASEPSTATTTQRSLNQASAGRMLSPAHQIAQSSPTTSQTHLQAPGQISRRDAINSMANPEELAKMVEIRKQWSAHTEPVQKIEVIKDPPAILSYSSDRRVRAWSIDGQYYGTLRQCPDGGRWALPVDLDSHRVVDSEQDNTLLSQLPKASTTTPSSYEPVYSSTSVSLPKIGKK